MSPQAGALPLPVERPAARGAYFLAERRLWDALRRGRWSNKHCPEWP